LKKGVPAKEIAVLAPFRAQAATVRGGIRKLEDISDEDKSELVADTVDKMQGQEREVIIYSFTAGDPDYISEMADFLYNPNKLNVAFSRAKSKLIIVGNIKQLRNISPVDYPHISKMLDSDYIKMI
jgi:superfamily I DNA and/or RNA helicase